MPEAIQKFKIIFPFKEGLALHVTKLNPLYPIIIFVKFSCSLCSAIREKKCEKLHYSDKNIEQILV